MKVAIATTSEYEAVEFRKLLFKKYKVTKAEEDTKDGLFTSVFTTDESNWKSILKMFSLIEAITGINPYTHKVIRCHQVVKAKAIAAIILRDKYGLSTTVIAYILGYKTHASVVINTRYIVIKNIKRLPIELVIRQIIQQLNNPPVINTDSQVQ